MNYLNIKPNEEIILPNIEIKEGELYYKKIKFSIDYPLCCDKEAEFYIQTKEPLPNGLYFLISLEGDKKEWNITKSKIKLPIDKNLFNLIIRYDKSITGFDICKTIKNINFIIQDNCNKKNCSEFGILLNKFIFDINIFIPLDGRLKISKAVKNDDGELLSYAWGCCLGNYKFDFYFSENNEFGHKKWINSAISNKPYDNVYINNLIAGWYHVKITSENCEIWKSILLVSLPKLKVKLIPELKFSECYDPCEPLDVDCISIYKGNYKKKYWNISPNSASNGHVSIVIEEGIPPFFYYWSERKETENEANNELPLQENKLINKTADFNDINKGIGIGDLINVSAGWYAFTLKDLYDNEFNSVIYLSEPPIPSADIEGTDVQLYGQNNGSLKVQIQGQTAPYSFYWNYSPLIKKNYFIECDLNILYDDNDIIKRRVDKLNWKYEKDIDIGPVKANSWDWSCEYYEFAEFRNGYLFYTKQDFLKIISDLPIPEKKSADNSFFEYSPPNQGVKAGIYDLTIIDCTGLVLKGREVILEPDPLVICIQPNNACEWNGLGNAELLIEWGNPPFIIDLNRNNFNNININENPPIKYKFDNLQIGDYEVKVVDKLGQIQKLNFVIYQPENWDIDVIDTDIKLINTNTGYAKIDIIKLNNTPYDLTNEYIYNLYKLPENNLLGNKKEWLDLEKGHYKFEIIPTPLLCQKPKIKEFEITEPQPINFNFEFQCECCNGIDGYIKIKDIIGGYDTNYKYQWFFENLLLDNHDIVLENPKTGNYTIIVMDSVGNKLSKSVQIPQIQTICFEIIDKLDLIDFGSKQGRLKVKKTIKGIDPVFWRIYKKQENLLFSEIQPKFQTIDENTIEWSGLDKGIYKIEIKDKCSKCEEILEIKEKPNPCLDSNNELLFKSKSLFTPSQLPIELKKNEPKKINLTITLGRTLCCTETGKGIPNIGTAYFNIETGYPSIKWGSSLLAEVNVQNAGKTLVIKETVNFPSNDQIININLEYDGTNINENKITISGNKPCFEGIILPIKLIDCCSDGCCERGDCCPDKINECCCPKDIVCKDRNHPRFNQCCSCNDLSLSEKNALCADPKFLGTQIYNDCCKCTNISKEVLNNTICIDPNHPQLEECCNCREHRILREKICLATNPNPNDPLVQTCCPCDMIKDVICNDKNHPRYVECCNPCEPDCCKNGTCKDVRLCCDCKDFDLSLVCINPDDPFYDKCCQIDCCDS